MNGRIERCQVLSFSFDHYAKKSRSRDEAIVLEYDSGGYGTKEIGDHFGLHYSRASRIISGLGRAKDIPDTDFLPKNLPLLTMPRQIARNIICAQRLLNRVP